MSERAHGHGPTKDEIMAALEPQVSTRRLVIAGNVIWLVALGVILLVPSLHTGTRRWWPWVPVTGFALGVLGLVYLALGKGNAAEAD